MSGESAAAFGPGHTLERGEFLRILCRFFGWEEESTSGLPYTDVTPGDWYAGAVAAAYRKGAITSQVSEARPRDPITREELAVILVRALGYQSLAGLAEPVPFKDVNTNTGYLGIAHNLGLMNGSGGLFMPANNASRAHTAAVLARLYRKLTSPAPKRVGIAASLSDMNGWTGLHTAAVQAVRLTQGSGLSLMMSRESAAQIRDTARSMGAEALLCADGETLYRESVSLLLEEAAAYDGVFLNVSSVPDESYVRQIREGLGGKRLYLAVPSPAVDALVAFEALAESADVLVVRIPGETRLIDGFPMDPVEPMDQLYAALCLLKERVGAEKVSVMLSTGGNLWSGGQSAGTISGQDVEALLNTSGVKTFYSDRYEPICRRRLLRRSRSGWCGT